jgi:hypothetical protein
MPVCAYNPRGTSGSGKTTIVRELLRYSGATPVQWAGKKPVLYQGQMMSVPLWVIGSYQTTCGGCDTIDSVHKVAELLVPLMNDPGPGIVIYEGLMISHMIGTVGAAVKPYGQRHVMAFLDTPLQTCLDRVRARRLAAGQTKPLNVENTTKDHRAVQNCMRNAADQGFRVVSLNHLRASQQTMEILNELSKLSLAGPVDDQAGGGTARLRDESEEALD